MKKTSGNPVIICDYNKQITNNIYIYIYSSNQHAGFGAGDRHDEDGVPDSGRPGVRGLHGRQPQAAGRDGGAEQPEGAEEGRTVRLVRQGREGFVVLKL